MGMRNQGRSMKLYASILRIRKVCISVLQCFVPRTNGRSKSTSIFERSNSHFEISVRTIEETETCPRSKGRKTKTKARMPGRNSNPDSIWLYDPSLALAIVFTVIYTLPLVWQIYLTVFRYRACYFSVVIVGAAFEVGGYISRAVSIKQEEQIVSRLFQFLFRPKSRGCVIIG